MQRTQDKKLCFFLFGWYEFRHLFYFEEVCETFQIYALKAKFPQICLLSRTVSCSSWTGLYKNVAILTPVFALKLNLFVFSSTLRATHPKTNMITGLRWRSWRAAFPDSWNNPTPQPESRKWQEQDWMFETFYGCKTDLIVCPESLCMISFHWNLLIWLLKEAEAVTQRGDKKGNWGSIPASPLLSHPLPPAAILLLLLLHFLISLILRCQKTPNF